MTFPSDQNSKPINSAVTLKQIEDDTRQTKQGNRGKGATQMISLNMGLLQLYEDQLGLGESYTSVWMAVRGGGEMEGAVWSAFTDEDDRAVDDWSVLCYCSELQMDRSTCHHLAPQPEMAFLLSAFQQSVSVTKDCWESEPQFHSTLSLHKHTCACTHAYKVVNILPTWLPIHKNPIKRAAEEGP